MKIEQTNLSVNIASDSKKPQISPDLSDKKALARDFAEFSQKSRNAALENLGKNQKKEKKKADDDYKAYAIAARIMAGDKVPQKDEKFLREHDVELYARAKMFAVKKIKAKKHKSVFEDEKDGNSNETDAGGSQNSDADSLSVDNSSSVSAD